MNEPITFECAVSAVKTLADGGIRVTLDMPESVIMQAAALMECKRLGLTLYIEATPQDKQDNHEFSRKVYG